MTSEEIMELNLSLPGITDYSKQKTPHSSNEKLVQQFCEMADIAYDDKVLARYSIYGTRAGQILFGDVKYRIVEYNEEGDVLRNEVKMGLLGFLSDEAHQEIRVFYSRHAVDVERITDSMLRDGGAWELCWPCCLQRE